MADQSNSGRNALILGAVFGMAAAGLGVYVMTSCKVTPVDTDIPSSKGNSSLVAEAQAVKDSLKADRTVKDVAPEGATINGQPRLAPPFFATELWQVTLDDAQKNAIIDIYDPTAANIHGDVPNTWFITNGIADALGRADGLMLDSDNDGFSNKEEFDAETNPSDAASYPSLVRVGQEPKLEVVKVDTANALITVDSMFADATQKPAEVKFRLFKKVEEMSPYHQVTLKPGESFDLDPKEKGGRFTVVGFEKKQFPDFSGSMADENVVRVRDNVTAGAEKEFVIRAGKPTATSKDKGTPQEKGRRISDKTVTLRVTSGSAVGKPAGTVRVQLNGSFDIPGGNCTGEKMTATVESIDAAGSVNIRVSGIESPVSVPKAGGKPAESKK